MGASEPAHAVAVVGGACAGSVVAEVLADAGCRVAVFEQNPRPYGKIEDGLPRWHDKQRRQEFARIDARLDRPDVAFVPDTRLGVDIDFRDFVCGWGWSVVVLANGAWADRMLAVPGAAEALGHGLVYQNEFVRWFNHEDELGYDGPRYEVSDGAVVVGGGLASIDVAKIIQLELYAAALRARGVDVSLVDMEHHGIPRYCAAHGVADPAELGVGGCLLLYRRRVRDMPLATLSDHASDAQKARLPQVREKILETAQRKFLFEVAPQRLVRGLVVEDGHVTGLRLARDVLEGDAVRAIPGSEYVHPTRLVVSSIGSLPEPIEGIEMDGSYYDFSDVEAGAYGPLPHVFAAGNVVAGQGNIKASEAHGRAVGHHVAHVHLETLPKRPRAALDALFERVAARQRAVGYDGDYRAWIDGTSPPGRGSP